MTRIPFDQLSKQYLEAFLSPSARVQRQLEVPGEPKFVDIWFTPTPTPPAPPADLGLLSRIATTPCLLEPFRHAPTRQEIKTCLLKLLWVQEEQHRQRPSRSRTLAEHEQPHLWILAATANQPVLDDFGTQVQSSWGAGVHFLVTILQTAIVVIDRLPATAATLWLRILGRDQVQEQAVSELLALPKDDMRRSRALELLVNWRLSIELSGLELETGEAQLMATLSQAYLEWEQQTEQRGRQQGWQQGRQEGRQEGEQIGEQRGRQEGERSLLLRQLTQKFGSLPERTTAQISTLNLEQLEALAIALLNFSTLAELEAWLQDHSGSRGC